MPTHFATREYDVADDPDDRISNAATSRHNRDQRLGRFQP